MNSSETNMKNSALKHNADSQRIMLLPPHPLTGPRALILLGSEIRLHCEHLHCELLATHLRIGTPYELVFTSFRVERPVLEIPRTISTQLLHLQMSYYVTKHGSKRFIIKNANDNLELNVIFATPK